MLLCIRIIKTVGGDSMFYDRFNELCNEKGVTPVQLRKELGISQSTVASWKSRGLTPKGITLQRLADYFGVSVNYLLGAAPKHEIIVGGDSVFYDRFMDLCVSAGVTPTQVARDIGVNRSTVSMWKIQGTTPKYAAMVKLSKYFNVSVDYLQGTSEHRCSSNDCVSGIDAVAERDLEEMIENIIANLMYNLGFSRELAIAAISRDGVVGGKSNGVNDCYPCTGKD